jgi:hypothetical protein
MLLALFANSVRKSFVIGTRNMKYMVALKLQNSKHIWNDNANSR